MFFLASENKLTLIHGFYKLSHSWIQGQIVIQGGSNMTGTDMCVNKPHCAAAVRP